MYMRNLFFLIICLLFSPVIIAQKLQTDTTQYPVYGVTQIKNLSYPPITIITIESWVYDKNRKEILYANTGLSSGVVYPALCLTIDKDYVSLMLKHGYAMLKRHYRKEGYVKPDEIPETSIGW